jgi:hypothetical protein
MSKRAMPWYKREPRAFYDATIGWPFELKATYGMVIDILHMHGGRVADDSAYWVAMLGLSSKRKWTTLKNELLERGKLDLSDGYLTNIRVLSDLKVRDKSEIIRPVSNKNNDLKNTDKERDREEELDTGKSVPYENYKPLSSSSSNGATTDDDGFQVFWVEFCHAQPSSQAKARVAWDRLTPDDRQAALDAAKAMTDPPDRGVLAFSWLEERHWRFAANDTAEIIRFERTDEERAERMAQLQAAYDQQKVEGLI